MSATSSITPTGKNQIAIDYICPKTAGAVIYARPNESGTDYAGFDGANSRFQCNKIEPLSGSTINMGSSTLLTGLASSAARANPVLASQIIDSSLTYAITTGTQPTYVLSPVVPIIAYADGQKFSFKCHSTNTSAPTINISGVGAKNIKKGNGTSNLSPGELQSGGLYEIQYVASISTFILTNATWQSAAFTPVITGSGSIVTSAPVFDYCYLVQSKEGMKLFCRATFTTTGTGDIIYLTGLPVLGHASFAGTANPAIWTGAGYEDGIGAVLGNYVEVRKYTAFVAGAGKVISISADYRLPD